MRLLTKFVTPFVAVPLTMAARILLLMLPLLMAGCGQTGPLYLPEPVETEFENTAEVVAMPHDPNAP